MLFDWACDSFGDFVIWLAKKTSFLAKFFPEPQEDEAPSVYAVFFREAMHGLNLPGTFMEFVVIFFAVIVFLPIAYIIVKVF